MQVPWGNFRGNHSSWGSFFKLFVYFVCIAHFTAEWYSFSLLWAFFSLFVCLFVCLFFYTGLSSAFDFSMRKDFSISKEHPYLYLKLRKWLPSPLISWFQINWLTSISIASVVVSAVVLEAYTWALKTLLGFKFYEHRNDNTEGFRYFWAKDTKIKFEDQENTMIAIHALIVIFTICEIILAVATARSGETGRQSPQENQVCCATQKRVINLLHLNIRIHFLHNILYTFPMILTKRIC